MAPELNLWAHIGVAEYPPRDASDTSSTLADEMKAMNRSTAAALERALGKGPGEVCCVEGWSEKRTGPF